MSFANQHRVGERTYKLYSQLHPAIPEILQSTSIDRTWRRFLPHSLSLNLVQSDYKIEEDPNAPGVFIGKINFLAPKIRVEVNIRPIGKRDEHVVYIITPKERTTLTLEKNISTIPSIKQINPVFFTITQR